MRCTHTTQGGKGRRCINMRLSLSKGHIVSFFFYLGLQTSYKAKKKKKKNVIWENPSLRMTPFTSLNISQQSTPWSALCEQYTPKKKGDLHTFTIIIISLPFISIFRSRAGLQMRALCGFQVRHICSFFFLNLKRPSNLSETKLKKPVF